MKKQRQLLTYLIAFLLFNSCNTSESTNETEVIAQLMQEQENCWNQGDLTCYMQHYWQSDSLTFIGKSGINYGWKTTLTNYKKSYPDKTQMGVLTFKNNSIKQLSNNYIHVIGKWHLKRSDSLGDLMGHYTLVWEKISGKWVITSDHSS
jgi:hypothetical protein